MSYKLRCPGCSEVFKWAGKDWPNFCPLCGFSTALPERDEIQAPHTRDGRAKAMLKSADQTYRGYEAATEKNAQQAADIAGVPVSEMSGLRITNMESQLRPGDLAAKHVTNDVSRMVDANKDTFGYQTNPSAAIGMAANAHSGKHAHAGAGAFGMLREIHQKTGAASVVPTKEVLDRTARQGGKVSF